MGLNVTESAPRHYNFLGYPDPPVPSCLVTGRRDQPVRRLIVPITLGGRLCAQAGLCSGSGLPPEKHEGGVLVVTYVVDESGQPQRVRVVRPLSSEFDDNAIQAAERYRFEPALLQDEA